MTAPSAVAVAPPFDLHGRRALVTGGTDGLGPVIVAALAAAGADVGQDITGLTAQGYIGEVIVADIGAPRELVEQLGKRLEEHELLDRPEDPRPEALSEPPERKGRPEA